MQEIHTIKQICRNFWSCVNPNKTKYAAEGWRQVLASQPLSSHSPRAVLKVILFTFSKKVLEYPPSGEDAGEKSRVEKVSPFSAVYVHLILLQHHGFYCTIVFMDHHHHYPQSEELVLPGESKPDFPITNGACSSLLKIHSKRAASTPFTRRTLLLHLQVCSS